MRVNPRDIICDKPLVLIFTTSTTWLEKYHDQIIQFSCVLWYFQDQDFFIKESFSTYINTKVNIDGWAIAYHNITRRMIEPYGYMLDYLHKILFFFRNADVVVWYNLDFHVNMLKYEAFNLWVEIKWVKKNFYDIMEISSNIMKIRNPDWIWYKNPSLKETYKYLFNVDIAPIRDSRANLKNITECFLKLFETGQLNNYDKFTKLESLYSVISINDNVFTYKEDKNIINNTWEKSQFDDWYDEDWYDKNWYDIEWYDRDWYNEDWYDEDWYDRDWYAKDWYDRDWYDRDWYDEEWFNRDWIAREY